MTLVYGDKRNYRKIDIYVDGIYQCSTTWSKTCRDAKKRFIDNNVIESNKKITAYFAKG